jgi:hypothetical protein
MRSISVAPKSDNVAADQVHDKNDQVLSGFSDEGDSSVMN